MGGTRRLIRGLGVATLVAIASGCRSEEPEPRLPEPRPIPTDESRPTEPPASGRLVEGTESFGSLRLPLGFQKTEGGPTSAKFEGNADAPRVVQYVRDHLATGDFVGVGDGGRFVHAVPKGADPRRVKLLVRVVSLGPRRTSLQIVPESLEPPSPMSEEERMRAWQEQLQKLD